MGCIPATETTESATEDSSTTEQSDSSESYEKKGDIAEESKDSTSESESDEESTVKFGSIKRRPPVKSTQKQEAEMRKSNIKTSESASRPINKKVSDSSDSDEDISLPEKRKLKQNKQQ